MSVIKKIFASKITTFLLIVLGFWTILKLNNVYSHSAWINIAIFLGLIILSTITIALIYRLFSRKKCSKSYQAEEEEEEEEKL